MTNRNIEYLYYKKHLTHKELGILLLFKRYHKERLEMGKSVYHSVKVDVSKSFMEDYFLTVVMSRRPYEYAFIKLQERLKQELEESYTEDLLMMFIDTLHDTGNINKILKRYKRSLSLLIDLLKACCAILESIFKTKDFYRRGK